jgi:hypothetical protein
MGFVEHLSSAFEPIGQRNEYDKTYDEVMISKLDSVTYLNHIPILE